MDFKIYPPHTRLDVHAAWSRAAMDVDQADPFCCTPEWQMSFHDAFSPERKLLIESDSDNVVAFAEYRESDGEIFLIPIEAHWFFGSPLLGRESVELFADLLPAIEQHYHPVVPKFLISGIRPEAELPYRLFTTFGEYYDFYRQSPGLQCAASLFGGLDGYLSRRSANHRKKLKKQSRRANDAGVYFERVAPLTAEEAHQTYARMIAVEDTSWKGIGKCGMTETPALEFYDAMMQRLADTQSGRIIFARHENNDIGFIFGGMAGPIYRGQQFSYDEAWKNHSIGNLMQLQQVTWLTEENATRYDMGPIVGPRMGYKKHWTEIGINIETWVMIKK